MTGDCHVPFGGSPGSDPPGHPARSKALSDVGAPVRRSARMEAGARKAGLGCMVMFGPEVTIRRGVDALAQWRNDGDRLL
jgi:hypothetical protein